MGREVWVGSEQIKPDDPQIREEASRLTKGTWGDPRGGSGRRPERGWIGAVVDGADSQNLGLHLLLWLGCYRPWARLRSAWLHARGGGACGRSAWGRSPPVEDIGVGDGWGNFLNARECLFSRVGTRDGEGLGNHLGGPP